ncbi:MAG: hypothetical protein MZV64_10725 [Ignavibacteriales bacterium]|nr:hypothetical protein [Ignavibacteriales bacterium]
MKKAGEAADPFWKDAPLVDENEIFSELHVKRGSSLFLGRYSLNEVLAVLNKKGFLKEARKRFLWPLAYEFDSSEYPLQRLQIYLRDPDPENIIVDVKLKECEFVPRETAAGPANLPPAEVAGLRMADPPEPAGQEGGAVLAPARPDPSRAVDALEDHGPVRLHRPSDPQGLPPGLPGLLPQRRPVLALLPLLEPASRRREVLAIRRTFSHMPFRQLAWVVHLNCLRRADGSVYEWQAEEQLYPMTRPLKDYFDSRRYREVVKARLKSWNSPSTGPNSRGDPADIPTFCGGA